jgi:RpiB/LacA/LacB family sugar-phosphate isomerase
VRIIIASDHAGYRLKQCVTEWLRAHHFEFTDLGVDHAEVSVDYPDFAFRAVQAIIGGEYECGILVCGSGQGMAIAANRVPGIRAAVCHDEFTAHQSRAHNNANVLCLGERVVSPDRIPQILEVWLNTAFEGEVHARRIAKIEQGYAFASQEQKSLPCTDYSSFRFGLALSPNSTKFAPIVFAGHLDKGIEAAAAAGFSAVEVSVRSAEDIHVARLLQTLTEKRLSLAAFATGQACLEDNLCLCSTDATLVQKTVNRLKGIIDLATQFQSMVIIGGIRGKLSGDGHERERQRESAVRAMRECARYAEQRGVLLLIEPINRYETNFINTAAEGLTLLAEVGVPSLKLLLDTFHMNIEEIDISQTLVESREHLGYVHIADSNRRAPGQGHINFGQIFNTLVQIHFQGYITCEILPSPDDQTAVEQAASFLNAAEKASL